MRKLLSISYSVGAFNAAILLLRLGVGILMMKHGYDKLIDFSNLEPNFMNFMEMGSKRSLELLIFAEFYCSGLIILGLFTRLASMPLIIATCIMIFKAHNGEVFGDGQTAALYLISYLVLLFVGPGSISVSALLENKIFPILFKGKS